MASPFDNEIKGVLPVKELFSSMLAINHSLSYMLGKDDWRRDILDSDGKPKDSLSMFDSRLAMEVARQAKSKGGNWDRPKDWNVWPAVHIGLLLPTVGRVLESYAEAGAKLTYDETARFWSGFPYAVRHCKEYKEFAKEYADKTSEQIKAEWDNKLELYFKKINADSGMQDILKSLPEPLNTKVSTALRHQKEPAAENDSLVGRMILAYLADRKDIPLERLNMHTGMQDYLKPFSYAPQGYKTKTLYERLLDLHVEGIPKLIGDVPILDYRKDTQIPVSDLYRMYRWFGTGRAVEMVKPDLVGAAQLGVGELSALFDHLDEKYGLRCHENTVMADRIELFRSVQSPEKLGRLSLVMNIMDTNEKRGNALRVLAGRLWSEKELQAAWGNASIYVPESRNSKRDFGMFKQDIGNIIYSAGLFEEGRGNKKTADSLKSLAYAIKEAANDLDSVRNVLSENKDTINELVHDWQKHYPESGRSHIMQFVQQTFGLKPIKPIPIPMDDISLGFEGSQYRPDTRKYHIKYREAQETMGFDVLLPKRTVPKGKVKYHMETEGKGAFLEIIRADGKMLSVPVPGRGSYDPFGTTGSPHAGEIVGYGCSMHHASLAVMLAELASLGADLETLKGFKDKFMQINPDKHHRQNLADFQVAQIYTAFNEGHVISYAEYMGKNPEVREKLIAESGHEHTKQYLENPDREPTAASATRARLAYGYGDLYPCDEDKAKSINPRDSWYVTDINPRLLPTGDSMRWQAIQSDKLRSEVDQQVRSISR